MGAFAAGQVVLLPFPFSDLTRSKLRPALLLADAGRDDWIACQITSNPYADPRAILLASEDFTSGGLQRASYARPGKLFTANTSLFAAAAGLISQVRLDEVRNALIGIIQG
ncbi:MAG: type II toxin-antitoxin system PemK/MazF family toxin [Thiobacillus sp.]|uniref:type II toxin-antitoxin system PemK/MazF family toxin n=1 Tax=Thiobacillus sp. TaxID=924 RepID=UPI002735E85F|nr:type II toxin-antitoxin system PemK/MazF family toxin [Thiobacillus sp.]MDP3584564.1 type II toxin-antitoxin system PemK/MazF family toxin [Thiobacillus sp.]